MSGRMKNLSTKLEREKPENQTAGGPAPTKTLTCGECGARAFLLAYEIVEVKGSRFPMLGSPVAAVCAGCQTMVAGEPKSYNRDLIRGTGEISQPSVPLPAPGSGFVVDQLVRVEEKSRG